MTDAEKIRDLEIQVLNYKAHAETLLKTNASLVIEANDLQEKYEMWKAIGMAAINYVTGEDDQ